jgi:epoxyqueuosine reductase
MEGLQGYLEEVASRDADYDFFLPLARGVANWRATAPRAKSVLVALYDCLQTEPPPNLVGKIGRIYLSRSYNPPPGSINHARFQLLVDFLERNGCATMPQLFLPLRWVGAMAGCTSFGRNSFAYAEGLGSFVTISAVAVEQELVIDEPAKTCLCPPDCGLCLQACPTGALRAPFKMRPRECLAFNAMFTAAARKNGTTDHIPRQYRPLLGQMVHGCDICQEVCPRNQAKLKAQAPQDAFLASFAKDFSLAALLHFTDEIFVGRARAVMYNYFQEKRFFQRNAAVALGNAGDAACVPDLAGELASPDDVVRTHVAWALGRIGGSAALAELRKRQAVEADPLVLEEIALALASGVTCVSRRPR